MTDAADDANEDGAPAAGARSPAHAAEVGETTTDPDETDYAWVMQTTFVVTILVGAPIVTLLSLPFDLVTWGARAEFALRVGAVIYFVTAIGALVYEKQYRTAGDAGE
ncbi:DUF5822 domain-containing protein [Haloarchaeobius sp. TZWWS8]|uniref:DUF5822 domain-containing protein n=1 Tax=Haloarchaeobius sp. TZWWS8 TaxID=3446121 RepID=UPI003EBABE55